MKNNKHIFKIYAYKKQAFEVNEIGHASSEKSRTKRICIVTKQLIWKQEMPLKEAFTKPPPFCNITEN